MNQINLQDFKDRLIDGTYACLWDIQTKKWMRLHKVDALDGLRNGSFRYESEDGSQPPAELMESSFDPRRHAQAVARDTVAEAELHRRNSKFRREFPGR